VKEQIELPDDDETHSLKSSTKSGDSNNNPKKTSDKKEKDPVPAAGDILKPEQQDAFRGFTWSLQPEERDAIFNNQFDDSLVITSSRTGINPQEFEAEIAQQQLEQERKAQQQPHETSESEKQEETLTFETAYDQGRLQSFNADHASASEHDLPAFLQTDVKEELIKK